MNPPGRAWQKEGRELRLCGVTHRRFRCLLESSPKSHSPHFIFASSNQETVISMFCEQMKPQGGGFRLPECDAERGEKAGFNGGINFCKTLKTSALSLLCFPYEVNNFCLILSPVQIPVKPENNLHFSTVCTFCRFYGSMQYVCAIASRFKHQELKPLRRN